MKSIKYWNAIDLIKGILILLVFIGHIFVSPDGKFAVYIIYSFHMPLFIGISGFLFNYNKKPLIMIQYYFNRLIIPWIIAVLCYNIVNIKVYGNIFSIKYLIKDFVYPFCHLWYILGLLSYILIAYILIQIFKKSKYKWFFIISISGIISIISKMFDLFGVANGGVVTEIINILHTDFRLFNFIFFIIGVYCRYMYENKMYVLPQKFVVLVRLIVVMCMAITICLYYFNNNYIKGIMYFVMNIFLIFIVTNDCLRLQLPRCKAIEFLGKYSLPIYLYHILCDDLGQIIYPLGSTGYYIVSVFSFAILCITFYYLKDIKIVKKYLFGLV